MNQQQGFDLGKTFHQLLSYGNSRALELYQPSGQRLLRLPLTWAVVLGVVALVAHLVVPVVIAVVVLLVLKFRFVLSVDPARAGAVPPQANVQATPPQDPPQTP